MKATIDFARVERVPSGTSQLGAQAYRVDFELAASEGPYGCLPGPQAKEMRSRLSGTVSIEIPVDQAGEGDMVARAREVLHGALTQLAEAARPSK